MDVASIAAIVFLIIFFVSLYVLFNVLELIQGIIIAEEQSDISIKEEVCEDHY